MWGLRSQQKDAGIGMLGRKSALGKDGCRAEQDKPWCLSTIAGGPKSIFIGASVFAPCLCVQVFLDFMLVGDLCMPW